MKKEIGTCGDCRWFDGGAPLHESTCTNSGLWDIVLIGHADYAAIVPDADFGCIHWEEKEVSK